MTSEDAEEAKRRIELITAEVEIGKVYPGKVVKVVDFGAFIEIMPGKQGLLHVSQFSNERIENVYDHISEGQELNVRVLDIDNQYAKYRDNANNYGIVNVNQVQDISPPPIPKEYVKSRFFVAKSNFKPTEFV